MFGGFSATESADFWIPTNGPIPTILEQVGLGVSEELEADPEFVSC